VGHIRTLAAQFLFLSDVWCKRQDVLLRLHRHGEVSHQPNGRGLSRFVHIPLGTVLAHSAGTSGFEGLPNYFKASITIVTPYVTVIYASHFRHTIANGYAAIGILTNRVELEFSEAGHRLPSKRWENSQDS